MALAIELQLDAQGAAAAEAAVGSPEAGASTLHGQGFSHVMALSAPDALSRAYAGVDLLPAITSSGSRTGSSSLRRS